MIRLNGKKYRFRGNKVKINIYSAVDIIIVES